jgi:MarR family transcriptional regulator, transcriptional regulator for hemolysin
MATEIQEPATVQGTSGCLTGNLAWMLDQAHHAFGCEMAAALAPLGVGQRGFCVLSAAIDAELTQTQLAGLIGLDKTTMVVTVDELERLGLAERVASPTDRRARVIRVTDAGRTRVAEGQAIVAAVQADVLDTLPDAEREAFVSGLLQLVSGRLSSAPQCHPPLRRREPRA